MAYARVGQIAGVGTTGNKTISLTAGDTPWAIIVWCTTLAAAGTGTSTDPTNYCIGVGTYRSSTVSQWFAGLAMESGDQIVTHNAALSGTDAMIKLPGAGDLDVATPTIDFELDLVSMQGGGTPQVVVNVVNAYTGAAVIVVHYMILCGSDITDAHCGTQGSLSSGNNDITVISGFGKPDLLLAASVWESAGIVGDASAQLSVGWGWDDSNQRVSNSSDGADNAATVIASSAQLATKLIQTINDNAAPALDWDAALAAVAGWPTDGFRVSASIATTDDFYWLALRGTFTKALVTVTSPGATGNQDNATGLSTPRAAFVWGDSQPTGTAIKTAGTTAPRLVSATMGAYDGTNQCSAGWSDDDANANQRGRSRVSTTVGLEMQSNSAGTVTLPGSATISFSGGNLRLNWSAVPSTGREVYALVIGDAGAAAAPTPKPTVVLQAVARGASR